MTSHQPVKLLRGIFLMLIVAILTVACSSSTLQSPPSAPSSESGAGQLEEIIVAGSKSVGSAPRAAFSGHESLAGDSHARHTLAARPGDEVWVIATPAAADSEPHDEAYPGSGAMMVNIPEDLALHTGVRQIPLPLRHTDVNARIDGYISSVNVRQQFENPFSEKIEAVYLFPLPEKSAINEFVMTIGDRRIRGILREKEEAEAIYQEARRQGYRASLLTQHRPNVFEQKVANIEPGKVIDIDISYFHTLSYSDGWYSFVFPTVVGPRFNPAGFKDAIEAISRGHQKSPGSTAAVTYLEPGELSQHDISISLSIDAGVAIRDIKASHKIEKEEIGKRTEITLANSVAFPNRDFVLSFKVAGNTIQSKLLTHKQPGAEEGYFTMMLYPPADPGSLPRQPMEMLFVLDCSGSMSGEPLRQAQDAVAAALSMLGPDDTFQIIRFSDSASRFGGKPVAATRDNIATAKNYLRQLNGSGGTMMIEGINAALAFPHDPSRLRVVSFMTDGFIGNETEIIGAIHNHVGASRIFSFGIGTSVNRYLLERMAKEGRGAVAYLGPQQSGAKVMSLFLNRAAHPALTDLQIDWGNMAVSDVYPAVLPDLFVGRPVVVTGKYYGPPGPVSVVGLAANETQQFVVTPGERNAAPSNLSKIWARLRIADLEDRQAWQNDPHGELGMDIKATALKYQLMSAYTSFVAVDASARTEGDHGVTVQQPVPVPQGVRYDTTVDQTP
jgi:Ca-activated chloride channel family protein